jgi:hypothetical protein
MTQKLPFYFLLIAMIFAATAGCKSSIQKSIIYPANDEILRYNLPYDLTFLRVLEAMGSMEGWDLEITEKEKGMIAVRNMDWTRPDDSDRRVIKVLVKRESRDITTVEIEPRSRHILGGGAILKRIEQYVSREL